MPAKVRSTTTANAFDAIIAIDKPLGCKQGDVLVAIGFNDMFDEGSAPSEWTQLATFPTEGSLSLGAWTKQAGASEPSSYNFGQPEGAFGTLHLLCVQDADPDISPQAAVGQIIGTDAPTPSVTPAAGSHLEIRAAAVEPYSGETTGWQPPSGYALRGNVQAAFQVASAVVSRQLNSSAPSGDKILSFIPDNPRFGVAISISLASLERIPDTGPPKPPFTPGRGIALYRWDFHLWDGTYLDTLDLAQVTFDKRIGQAGTFSASIPVTSSKIRNRVKRIISPDPSDLNAGPGVITCRVYRAGEPWGEYWITLASVSRSGREAPVIQLTGATMDAYMAQVEIQEALDFADEDQIDIARALIDSMQARDHANLQLLTQAGTSGITRTVSYAADQGNYGQRLQELGQAEGGFEWMVNIVEGAGGLERHWVWGAPLLGSGSVEHVFSDGRYKNDVLSWSEEFDALKGGTYWRARGDSAGGDASTSGSSLISTPALAQAYLDAGWPRTDRTVTFSSESNATTLDDYAAYWAANAGGALRVDSITVALGKEPTFTPNSLGDQARIFLENEWHERQSRVRRIIGIAITPPSREGDKETAQLVFEGIEVPSG